MSADDLDVAALVGRRIRRLKAENAELRALILVMDGWVEGRADCVFWGSIQGKAFTPKQAALWASITRTDS